LDNPGRSALPIFGLAQLAKVLQALEAIQKEFNASQSRGKKVSLADRN
jgi:catalase (peroxidase I)